MHPCGRARPAKNSVPELMSATVSTFRAIGNVGGLYDAYLAGGRGGERAPPSRGGIQPRAPKAFCFLVYP
jgi:hypothetical protein